MKTCPSTYYGNSVYFHISCIKQCSKTQITRTITHSSTWTRLENESSREKSAENLDKMSTMPIQSSTHPSSEFQTRSIKKLLIFSLLNFLTFFVLFINMQPFFIIIFSAIFFSNYKIYIKGEMFYFLYELKNLFYNFCLQYFFIGPIFLFCYFFL